MNDLPERQSEAERFANPVQEMQKFDVVDVYRLCHKYHPPPLTSDWRPKAPRYRYPIFGGKRVASTRVAIKVLPGSATRKFGTNVVMMARKLTSPSLQSG